MNQRQALYRRHPDAEAGESPWATRHGVEVDVSQSHCRSLQHAENVAGQALSMGASRVTIQASRHRPITQEREAADRVRRVEGERVHAAVVQDI
jgi:hypothetical protein